MAKQIQYVDFEGLKTFLSNLKTQYAGNLNSSDYKVQQAQIATYATSADASDDKSFYDVFVTKEALTTELQTIKVAGKNVGEVSTKEGMLAALSVADGAQVNVIETVKVNNTALTVTNKAVNIDLSSYALKEDITAVLKFQGAVDYEDKLPAINTANVGDVWLVKYRGKSTDSPLTTIALNAEFVYVENPTEHWEQFGSTGDFASYYTKTEIDTKVGSLEGKVTALETKASANSEAITTLTNTHSTDKTALEKSIKTNADNISTNTNNISTINTTTIPTAKKEAISSANTYTDNKVNALDVTDTANGFVETVNQTNGLIKVIHKTFDESVTDDSTSTNAPTTGAVATYVKEKFTTTVGGLTVPDTANGFVETVSQSNGKITVKHKEFDIEVSTTSTSTNAPTAKAVATFGKSCMVYDSEETTKVQITSMTPVTTASINGMFTTSST